MSLKEENPSEEAKLKSQQQLVRVRNIKLLIQDVFKQFDLLFKEIEKDGTSSGVSLGQIQADSVQSITNLLFMPSIDKKLLSAIGYFLFKICNFDYLKNLQKNQTNWNLIMSQIRAIACDQLNNLNDSLLTVLMKVQDFDLKLTVGNLNR